MASEEKKTETERSQLTPTILIVGAITLAGWLWFYSHQLVLDAGATMVLALAALFFVLLLRAVPYARIWRELTAKLKRHDTKTKQPRGLRR